MHSRKEDTSVLNHVCYSRSGVRHPGDDFFKAVVLEGGLGTSGGPKKKKILSRGPPGQNYVHNNI